MGNLVMTEVRGHINKAYDIKVTKEAEARIKDIVVAGKEAEALVRESKGFKVTDAESNTIVSDLVSRYAQVKKRLETLKKFFTKPLNDRKAAVIDRFKEWTAALLDEDDRLRKELEHYFQDQQQKEREEEQLRQKKHDDEVRASRQLGGAAPEVPADIKPEPTKTVTRTASGSVGIRMKWDFEIVSKNLVPETYKGVDTVAVNKAISSGVRMIPGLRIYERPITSAR